MIARTHRRVVNQLRAAESEGRCLIARERIDRDHLRQAKDEGLVVEVLPHVYVRTDYWSELKPPVRMRYRMHAMQELHPDWVFAGPSAAVAYGLAVSNRHLEELWVASSRRAHSRNGAGIRHIIVTGDEPYELNGLRLTSFERTVGDCLRLMDFRSGLAIADSALRVSSMTADQLAAGVRGSCGRMRGLLRVCAVLRLADARPDSGGESIVRASMLELGMASPDLQCPMGSPIDCLKGYRADYVWKLGNGVVIGELDGFEKYVNAEMRGNRSLSQVIEDEHRRQTHLEARDEVLRVVRFSFADAMRDEEFLRLLVGCGVPRTFAWDDRVVAAGGVLRCRGAAMP